MRDRIPSDAELSTTVDAMLPEVLTRIDKRERSARRHRIIAFAVGALALAVSTTLIGATVLAPVFNPGGGQLYNGNKFVPATFAVTCFSSAGDNSAKLSLQFSSQDAINKALSDLGAVCDSLTDDSAIQQSIENEATRERSRGFTCGFATVNGTTSAKWSYPKTGGDLSIISGPSPLPTADTRDSTSCAPNVSLSAPISHISDYASCAEASNWVVLYYPIGRSTPAEVCARHGYPVWGS